MLEQLADAVSKAFDRRPGSRGAVVEVIERARTGPSVPAGRYFAPPKCHPLITAVEHPTFAITALGGAPAGLAD